MCLSDVPERFEFGIMNFNLSFESGSHWVCYYKQHTERIYFDSYGQVIFYIKSDKEKYKAVIQRNTNDIQTKQNICGHLCMYVLKGLRVKMD